MENNYTCYNAESETIYKQVNVINWFEATKYNVGLFILSLDFFTIIIMWNSFIF